MPRRAKIIESTYHLPDVVIDNAELAALYPGWTEQRILDKTGIERRHVAAEDETAADLAFAAAESLLAGRPDVRSSIDYLIFCTQTPDYFLPSSSCLLHERLGLRPDCGAIDVNQGCSGFVYCLSLAKALIESSQVQNVLVLTGDTYSKLINRQDKSVRTLFGDAGAATLIGPVDSEAECIGACTFGTDGAGGSRLIVETGGFRERRSAQSAVVSMDGSGNARSRDDLYMDGADVLAFSLREVPRLFSALLAKSTLGKDDLDFFLFHQGSKMMLEMLARKLGIPAERFIIDLRETGNTVSSTIPVALTRLRARDPRRDLRMMLIGFGVGYSWAGALVTV